MDAEFLVNSSFYPLGQAKRREVVMMYRRLSILILCWLSSIFSYLQRTERASWVFTL